MYIICGKSPITGEKFRMKGSYSDINSAKYHLIQYKRHDSYYSYSIESI